MAIDSTCSLPLPNDAINPTKLRWGILPLALLQIRLSLNLFDSRQAFDRLLPELIAASARARAPLGPTIDILSSKLWIDAELDPFEVGARLGAAGKHLGDDGRLAWVEICLDDLVRLGWERSDGPDPSAARGWVEPPIVEPNFPFGTSHSKPLRRWTLREAACRFSSDQIWAAFCPHATSFFAVCDERLDLGGRSVGQWPADLDDWLDRHQQVVKAWSKIAADLLRQLRLGTLVAWNDRGKAIERTYWQERTSLDYMMFTSSRVRVSETRKPPPPRVEIVAPQRPSLREISQQIRDFLNECKDQGRWLSKEAAVTEFESRHPALKGVRVKLRPLHKEIIGDRPAGRPQKNPAD